MYIFGKLLSLTGGQGPILLLAAFGLGVTGDLLARLGFEILPVSAFLLTLGAFLTAGLPPCQSKASYLLLAVVLAWVGIGLPLVEASHLLAVRPDLKLRIGVMLSLLVPPVAGAVTVGAMLSRLGLELADGGGRIRVQPGIALAWAVAGLGPSPIAAGHLVACAVPALALLLVVSLSAAVYGLLLCVALRMRHLLRRRTADRMPASAERRGSSSPSSPGIRETA
jgi:hypothetical protein